jgi:hypothetical protein
MRTWQAGRDLVVIGASAGGLEPLLELIRLLGEDRFPSFEERYEREAEELEVQATTIRDLLTAREGVRGDHDRGGGRRQAISIGHGARGREDSHEAQSAPNTNTPPAICKSSLRGC